MRVLMGTAAWRRLRSYCSFWLIVSIVTIDCFALFEHGLWQASKVHAMSAAIKVETFEQDVGADGSTFSLLNDVGATSSAFIRMNTGTRKSSAGPIGDSGNTAPNVGTVGLVLTDTNQVTVERVNSTVVKVIGEVWRYQGITGGANEFITRDRVAVTMTGNNATVPVSGVINSDRVVPFVTGYTVDATNTDDWNEATIAVHMTDSGDLQVSRNNTGATATVYVDIVEFTGTNWTVCHGFSDDHDTTEQTISLNTSGDGQGGAVCDVGDWGTAAIIQATMEGDSAENGLSDTLALVRPGINTATVVFDTQQDGGAQNDGRAWIQVLQNDDLLVNRDSNSNVTEGDNSFDTIPFPAGVDANTARDELALEWFTDTSGVGTAHMRGGLHAGILDSSDSYADGDIVLATDYDSTQLGIYEAELTFAATPSGVIYEAGGTGTGAFVGYNAAGDFVIRAGNGGSVAPADAARIVIPDTEYDFANSTGTLAWQFAPDTNSMELSFDEGSDGSTDYSTSTTASAVWSDWSGGDDGGVGNSNGNIAGSELASGFDFNGTITRFTFSQNSGSVISHWIHRGGNNVGVEYGVIDLSNLEAITATTFAGVLGGQVSTTTAGVTEVFFGQQFNVTELANARNVTNVVLTESGTIDAAFGLSNVRLLYELDTTAPYNCLSESYDGTELQYGSTDSFSGSDGTAVFNDSVSISPTASFCAYVVADVTAAAQDGETVNFSIANTETDIAVTGGVVVSGGTLGAATETVVTAADITQTGYHWRNDDGNESGASSATGGVENTPGLAFAEETPQRLRLGVSAQGSGSETKSYKLEYGEKITTCNDVTTWVDVASGDAWEMVDSVNIFESGDTTNIPIGDGGVSDGVGTFVSPNGGVRDVSSKTGSLTIGNEDFVELEYSIQATTNAVEGLAYCFRVTDLTLEDTHSHRVSFTIPASSVDSSLTNFPVYVNLADLGVTFWDTVRTDGADIRVTTSDGVSEVPFEIVSIDTGNETGEMHFRAPALSDVSDTDFFIYFGDPDAVAYSPTGLYGAHNVWSNGYEAVYHLPTTVDSTGNGNTLTAVNVTNSGTTKVGTEAADFNGVNSVYTATNAGSILDGHPAVTFTGWIDSDVVSTDRGFLASDVIDGSDAPFCMRYDVGGFTGGGSNVIKGCVDTTGGPSQYETASNVQTTDWQHVVHTWQSGQGIDVYLDGVATIFTAIPPSLSGTTVVGSGPLYIGAGAKDSAAGGWDGRLDEIRFASVFRTSEWIAAEFSNQDIPGNFYTIGTPESLTPSPTSITYNTYPEATLNADTTVAATGTQIVTTAFDSVEVYVGGQFVITSNGGSRTVTNITVTETGTIDAGQFLSNPQLAIELDTTAPYDCASESYDGTETVLAGSAFTDQNGTTTFTSAVSINPTQALCAYTIIDVAAGAPDGGVISFEVSNPNVDVVTSAGSVGPGSVVSLAGETTVQAPSLTLADYHWRNDDGTEGDATSASEGIENTPIGPVFQNVTQRIRMAVVNEGSFTASGAEFRLEYGTKVTTCENVGAWQRVDSGLAFDMASSSQLNDGADTSDIATGVGGIDNAGLTFVSPNAGQAETADQIASSTITINDVLELEFAIQASEISGFGATYCFRLTDAGDELDSYINYPELTIQDRQDFIVQRGTETVENTTLTLTAGIDYAAPTNVNNTFVRITNTSMTGAGSDTLGQSRNPDEITAYIEGADSLDTSFSIVRPSNNDNTRVSWEMIEYVGVPGGDNEIIVRAQDEVVYGANDLFATGTAVSGISDDTDVAVFITGQLNPSNSRNNYNAGLSVSSWDAAESRPVFERGDADGVAAGVSYAVIEFTGVNWNVQRIENTFAAAGVVETQPITAVNSLERTFIEAQKLSGDELFNLDESGHEVWLSSIGAVSFQLESGATNPFDQRSVAWVVENTQIGDGSMQVYRSNGTIFSGGIQPITVLSPIGATVNPTNSSIWANMRSTGGGSAHPRAIIGARIFDDTQIELWKSDEGQNQSWRAEVIEWPVAETSIRQTHYRFYVDNDTATPSDPWPPGPDDLGENTTVTDLEEPLGAGDRIRIRTGLFINNASLISDSAIFKLQYARRVTTCSAIASWADVGSSGSGEIWRAADGTPADGTQLPSALLSVTNELGTYEENSPSTPNVVTVGIGDYIEYDWTVEHNGAVQKSSYCFRMTFADGSELSGYDVYPTIRTTGYTPVIVNWRWYDDADNLTPITPLASELVAPIDITASNTIKLRVALTEIEGAPGNNIKFNLQYSQWADFRDGGTTVFASSSCSGGTRRWCYADGAGNDNDIIDTTVLSNVDSCVSGVGDGCGTSNEAEGLVGVYDQAIFTTSEHEFTIQHDSVGFDQVYYFRLIDQTNGVPLVASTSFPSLVTTGAVLTFSVSGLDAGDTFEGVELDATTTPTTIDYGVLPVGSPVEAGQRLTVLTNGTEGYRVFLQANQQLTNVYGDEITSSAGTNAAPLDWATGCAGLAGCFGYHAGDNTLYDGSLRFALDDTFAGLSSDPVEVMASGVPVTFDTSEIIYRTEISETQAAGDYEATLQYIVVPIF